MLSGGESANFAASMNCEIERPGNKKLEKTYAKSWAL